jgi:2-oxoglutarate ferredoxin oxidoreductase subunit beta
MAAGTTTQDKALVQLKPKDFKGKVDPDWCPGCGDFGVLNCLQKACAELGLKPHQILTVSGIGCSSNLPGYLNAYGMHTLHGRPLAVATTRFTGSPRGRFRPRAAWA